MKEYFEGKTAFVTGAASGLGLAISRKLLAMGAASVFMADISEKNLKLKANELEKDYPGKISYKTVNVSKKEEVKAAIDEAFERFGRLDFVFNNAGIPMTRPTEKTSMEDFDRVIDINTKGAAYGCIAALPHMLKQGFGHIVNTASAGGLFPMPYQMAYAASKSAVITMTEALSYEYRSRNIYFSQFSPSNVATGIFSVEQADRMRAAGKSEEEIEEMKKQVSAPAEALSTDEACDIIFEGVSEKQVDILIGEDTKQGYELFKNNKAAADQMLLGIAEKRRQYYQAVEAAENNGTKAPKFDGLI